MCLYNQDSTIPTKDFSDANETCRYELTQWQEELWSFFRIWIEVYGVIIISALGLVFNFIAVIIFSHKDVPKNMFNRLLICLVIIDVLYLLISIIETCISIYPTFETVFVFFFIIRLFRDIMMCAAIYMVVLLSFERSRVFSKESGIVSALNSTNISWTDCLKPVVTIVLCSFFYKIPTIGEYTTETITTFDSNHTWCKGVTLFEKETSDEYGYITKTRITVTSWRSNYYYVLFNRTIADIFVTGIFPLILLLYFTYKIYLGKQVFLHRRKTILQRHKKISVASNNKTKNEISQTITLFGIVIIFIICNLLRILMRIGELINHNAQFEELEKGCMYKDQFWILILTPFSEFLLRLNSSVNFFIYWALNESFRSVIHFFTIRCLKKCGGSDSRNSDNLEVFEFRAVTKS